MGATLIWLALSAAGSPEPLPLREAVTVHDRTVRLGDIADLGALPPAPRDAAARAFLLRIEDRAGSVRLTRAFVVDRIRVQLPALVDALSVAPGADIAVTFAVPAPVVRPAQCLIALSDVVQGDVLKPVDFSPAPCATAQSDRTTRYDAASNTVVAIRPIGRGESIRRFAGYGSTAVTAGSTLIFRTQVAGVTIDRPVQALQSARNGGRLFVRAKDGTILSANLASDTP